MISISAEAFAEKHPDLSSPVIIDVCTPAEHGKKHVPGAQLIPLGRLRPRQLIENGDLPRDEPVYIMCQSGQRSKRAAAVFEQDGFDHAIVVEGGLKAWEKAGLPVENGETGSIGLERQVRIAAGALVLGGILLGATVHPAFYALSAFVGAGLVFAGITDRCGMAFVLEKAPWNR